MLGIPRPSDGGRLGDFGGTRPAQLQEPKCLRGAGGDGWVGGCMKAGGRLRSHSAKLVMVSLQKVDFKRPSESALIKYHCPLWNYGLKGNLKI